VKYILAFQITDSNNTIFVNYAKLYLLNNQNPYIEEEQTTQWPKEKSTKGQTAIYKSYT